MKLLFGTGNLAKLSAMKNRLEQLDIELIGLNDLRAEGRSIPEVLEDGNTPLENARLKAMAYYEAFQIPVFSCDSGLVKAYGNLVARCRNAICFVMDDTHIYEAMKPSMESEKFILKDNPHSAIRKKGFPLDSMSIDIKANKYYYDLTADELEQFAVKDGVLQFFQKILI